MKPVLFWPTCRSPESALSRIYPGSVNLFPEQSLEEWFRKNRRCSIAISGNGEKVKEITARGLPVNANNVAPPPLNGARKSIEELVNQVGVRFEEMLARAWYRWLKGTINQSVVAYKLSSNLITDPSLPRSNSLLSQNRSPPLSPRKLPPIPDSPRSQISTVVSLTYPSSADRSSRQRGQEPSIRNSPSTLDLPLFLLRDSSLRDRERERVDDASRDRRDGSDVWPTRVATKSILSILRTDCYAIEKRPRDRQGSRGTCVVLPSSINQGKRRRTARVALFLHAFSTWTPCASKVYEAD